MTIQPDPSHGAVVLHDRVPNSIAAYRSGWHSLQGGYGTALLVGHVRKIKATMQTTLGRVLLITLSSSICPAGRQKFS